MGEADRILPDHATALAHLDALRSELDRMTCPSPVRAYTLAEVLWRCLDGAETMIRHHAQAATLRQREETDARR